MRLAKGESLICFPNALFTLIRVQDRIKDCDIVFVLCSLVSKSFSLVGVLDCNVSVLQDVANKLAIGVSFPK